MNPILLTRINLFGRSPFGALDRFSPPLTFREAFVAALKGSAAVSALVGTSVFPTKLPQSQSTPALLYHIARVRRLHDLDGATTTSFASVQIACGALDPKQSIAHARAIRALFDGFTGSLPGGVVIEETLLDDESDAYDSNVDSSDDGTFWTTLALTFRFIEPLP